MSPKTIACAPLFLLVSCFAATASARGPAPKEKAVASASLPAPPPPAAAPAAPPPADNPDKAGQAEAGRTTAPDDDPAPDGFSIGARVGYALPMGSMAKDASLNGVTDLSSKAAGMVPLWADLGYRIDPHWYVGGYFQFGIIGTAGDWCNQKANGNTCSTSGTDIRFGALARYTFKPGAKIAPWVGVSSGYEITNMNITLGANTSDFSFKGWEFLGLHFGMDFRPAPAVSIGPAIMASFGQYAGVSMSQPGQSGSLDFTNTALHEWIFLGLRGQYDL